MSRKLAGSINHFDSTLTDMNEMRIYECGTYKVRMPSANNIHLLLTRISVLVLPQNGHMDGRVETLLESAK